MIGITYSSTRGSPSQQHLHFRTVVLQGLAHDRGLFVPDSIPRVSKPQLESWRRLTFPQLAVEVMAMFVSEEDVPRGILVDIVRRSCGMFRCEEVTPVVKVNGHFVLELFHGPTFAFKDVALQMLGNLFEYFLSTEPNNARLTVLGATSGDTGSAAIYGLRGKPNIDCIILYPHNRVSELQERQMTTVTDDNIHCIAIDGTFDDCQELVKASFANHAFRTKVHLAAVNSINWCRVLVQMTYYFWSYFRVTDQVSIDRVSYSVPTGNFGNVLAGYYAKQMGLPVGKLIVATNENDILHRFFTHGEYHRKTIVQTISPSMDICVSSNFERYLYHLANNDAVKLHTWMSTFESTGRLSVSGELLQRAQQDYVSVRVDTKMALSTIKNYYEQWHYMLCPHSAVGVTAIEQWTGNKEEVVCLATAHSAKFPMACSRAVEKLPPAPFELKILLGKEKKVVRLGNELGEVQEFILAVSSTVDAKCVL